MLSHLTSFTSDRQYNCTILSLLVRSLQVHHRAFSLNFIILHRRRWHSESVNGVMISRYLFQFILLIILDEVKIFEHILSFGAIRRGRAALRGSSVVVVVDSMLDDFHHLLSKACLATFLLFCMLAVNKIDAA